MALSRSRSGRRPVAASPAAGPVRRRPGVAPSPLAGALSGIEGVGQMLSWHVEGLAPLTPDDVLWCRDTLRRVYRALRAVRPARLAG